MLIQSIVNVFIIVFATQLCQSFQITRYNGNINLIDHVLNVNMNKQVLVLPRSSSTLLFADATDGGLSEETLNALGSNLDELADAATDAALSSSPDSAVIASIVGKLASSPAILAVPIGAGLLVSFLIGFFIYSYGRGSD